MARKKRDKIKEQEDQKLIEEVEKLQNRIALEQDLDQTTLDMSEDNVIASKVLQAEYSFLYSEARYRHTKFRGITNAITQ